ncbi:hypothetical protein IV498_03945 [Paenarthrobacter sp. Z7-10]|uniref:hypothetical protein n=1 Tax=Paenarthrobacter sp. Z7-10 TaxID=2787635 RepID=UPI0022A92C27|nr:hypothetical protein [Paenarthrobacter sp. Z7-10]MCZ2402354.1 hypothetical protein [Paenarthrobacter sp. Z7-10]
MSAAAPSNFQSILGNTARTLQGFGPVPARPGTDGQETARVRTPLSLVAGTPRRRRTPFVVFCFLTLVAALMTVLVLNISVSSGQYQLVQLTGQQADLLKANQDLTQQVQNAEAPQNLVAKAAELGMVSSNSMGQINLKTMAISGSPKPATAADKPMTVMAPPAVDGQQAAASAAADPAPASAPDPVMVPDTAVPAAHVVAPPAEDLHGGSIPSPQQKHG